MTDGAADGCRVHGTCVALNGRAALLIGGSGSGKSATALAMVAHGAELVADDQVVLTPRNDALIASCPEGYAGMIEARGIGIVRVPHTQDVPLDLVVDMDQTELQRLPRRRAYDIQGHAVDLIHGRDNWGLVAGVLAVLSGGRVD